MAWLKLGTFPDMTVENARKEAAKVLGEFATGANPAAVRRAVREESTFAEVLAEYLLHKRKRNGSPWPSAPGRVPEHRAPVPLDDHAGEALGHHARAGGEDPQQGGQDCAVCCEPGQGPDFSCSTTPRTSGCTPENPAEGITGFEEEARERFAQADELSALLAAVAQSDQRDYFLLSLLTGARRSNVQAMAWRELDLPGAVWRIGKTKNGTPQNVPLARGRHGADRPPGACRHLALRFPRHRQDGHLVEPKKAWATILRTASLFRLLDALNLDEAARTEAGPCWRKVSPRPRSGITPKLPPRGSTPQTSP
jgi:hypothetical protein